jgi:N-acetylglucosamine-6-phosphate deacetylase
MKIKEFINSDKLNRIQLADLDSKQCLLAIINAEIVNPFQPAEKKDLLIFGKKIIAVDDISEIPSVKNIAVLDAEGQIITPGFVDQHIHGGYGCDFNKSSSEDISSFLAQMPAHGVTSLVATIMTDDIDNINKQIEIIEKIQQNTTEKQTKIVGIHLEGPFLNPKYKGIHSDKQILLPTVENFLKIKSDSMKIVTYAPELDENFELTKYLKSKNIIASAGHTDIDLNTTKAATDLGLAQVTHSFNAMKPLHHRDPGIIGQMFLDDRMYAEIIPDCIHVHPAIIEIVLKIKSKEKVLFVSDSIPLNKAKVDNLEFGGYQISKKDNKAVNDSGTMAGSIMFLDEMFQKLQKENLLNLNDFIGYSSLNPSINLGFSDRGFIKEGCLADIVLWNKESFEILLTIIDGQIA